MEKVVKDVVGAVIEYECEITGGVPEPVDCQDVRWATIEELRSLALAPADVKILKRISTKIK